MAAQSVGEAQETPVSAGCPASTVAGSQTPAPGRVLVSTRPAESTATQRPVSGQDTPVSERGASIALLSQLEEPAVRAKALPAASTATHSPSGAQETALIAAEEM